MREVRYEERTGHPMPPLDALDDASGVDAATKKRVLH